VQHSLRAANKTVNWMRRERETACAAANPSNINADCVLISGGERRNDHHADQSDYEGERGTHRLQRVEQQ
jgi:hypothetical protein